MIGIHSVPIYGFIPLDTLRASRHIINRFVERCGMKIEAVLRLMQKECDKLGGQTAFARTVGVSPQYVWMVLNEQRPPTDAMLAALGLERAEQQYRRVRR